MASAAGGTDRFALKISDPGNQRMYTRDYDEPIDAYARTGPLDREELAHTPDFLAFRLALQAWYFSTRLAANDLTGIESRADNEGGLGHARRGLLGAD